MEAPSIVVPGDMLSSNDMVQVRWGDLCRLSDGFICAYYGITDTLGAAQMRYARALALSILAEAERHDPGHDWV